MRYMSDLEHLHRACHGDINVVPRVRGGLPGAPIESFVVRDESIISIAASKYAVIVPSGNATGSATDCGFVATFASEADFLTYMGTADNYKTSYPSAGTATFTVLSGVTKPAPQWELAACSTDVTVVVPYNGACNVRAHSTGNFGRYAGVGAPMLEVVKTTITSAGYSVFNTLSFSEVRADTSVPLSTLLRKDTAVLVGAVGAGSCWKRHVEGLDLGSGLQIRGSTLTPDSTANYATGWHPACNLAFAAYAGLPIIVVENTGTVAVTVKLDNIQYLNVLADMDSYSPLVPPEMANGQPLPYSTNVSSLFVTRDGHFNDVKHTVLGTADKSSYQHAHRANMGPKTLEPGVAHQRQSMPATKQAVRPMEPMEQRLLSDAAGAGGIGVAGHYGYKAMKGPAMGKVVKSVDGASQYIEEEAPEEAAPLLSRAAAFASRAGGSIESALSRVFGSSVARSVAGGAEEAGAGLMEMAALAA
jgi:hypothetical protein